MLKQYGSAKTVDAAAKAMGVTKSSVPEFRFGQNAGLQDDKLTGAICGTKPGNNVTAMAGDSGVIVFRVAGNGKGSFPYNAQQADQQYMQFINPNLSKMLRGNAKFENFIYKFEAGD